MTAGRGRTALVTGGGGGVGRAVARVLADQGARLALLGRGEAALARAAAALPHPVLTVVADVADRAAVERAVARVAAEAGAPTWLVQAAGVATAAPLLPPDDGLWRSTLATNVTGAWTVATACLPGMLASGGGAIVNIASTAALKGFRHVAAYVASKHALLGLTRAMAEDLRGKGITVNAVCPGFLDTEMTDRSVTAIVRATGRSAEEARAGLAALNARGRLIPPEEVAEAAVALLAEGGATGRTIVLD